MTSYVAYNHYLALKLHFKSPTYDYIKFRGVTKASMNAFNQRNDKYFFEKAAHALSEEKYLLKMLAEYKHNKAFFIKDIFTRENELRYCDLLGYLESFSQMFKKDLSKLKEIMMINEKTFVDLIKISDHSLPQLLKMQLNNTISLETLIALDHAVNGTLFKSFNDELSLDPLWEETFEFNQKYKVFISQYIPNKIELRNLMLDNLKSI